jgi:peptide/nickel transport system substrate-binding protein/oligopeptide transport system substrate-binding protein
MIMRSRGLLKLIAIASMVSVLLVALWVANPEASLDEQKTTKGRSIGGVYRRPLEHEPSTLDPSKISDMFGITVAEQVFDGLVRYDANLNVVPALAESWTASKDGLVWTFALRRGVKFHHGRELTADDVVYSFTRLLDGRRGSRKVQLLTMVKGARAFQQGQTSQVEGLEALNRYTVRATLNEPSAQFVSFLAVGHAKIVPREVVESRGDAFGREPVGSGPFRFVRWERSQRIILEANPDYFEGRPFLDRLVYKIFPGAQYDRILTEFEQGQLEDVSLPHEMVQRVTGKYPTRRRPVLGLRFLGINTQMAPFKDRRVRQAMNYAINRPVALPDVMNGNHLPAYRIVPESLSAYHLQLQGHLLASGLLIDGATSSFSGIPYDLRKARALFSEAGYPNGEGLPPIELWSSVKHPVFLRQHEAIQRAWAELGLRVVIRYNTDWPSYVRDLDAGKLPLYQYSWYADVPDPDDFLFNLFHSKGQRNYMGYHNPRVDDLLAEARRERTVERRMALYRTAEQLILTDAPLIPLIHHVYHWLLQPSVRGFEVNALGDPYIPMRKVWLERK